MENIPDREFSGVETGYKADVRILPVLARKMRVTVATLKRIIFDSGLFEVNDTTFSSPGLTRRMGPLEAKRDANRESGRRGGLANQQTIREGMASDALPINQTNDINNSPSISPQRETGKNEEVLLLPPEYALNKNTHNYEGLMEELQRQKVTVIKDESKDCDARKIYSEAVAKLKELKRVFTLLPPQITRILTEYLYWITIVYLNLDKSVVLSSFHSKQIRIFATQKPF